MSKNLVDGIKEWLDKGGYPLELYITKILRRLNYLCFKSPFYKDFELNKQREIDLVASIGFGNELNHFFTSKLVIECKKSSKPFVVLCDKSDEEKVGKNILFKNQVFDRDGTFVVFAQSFPHEIDFFSKRTMPVLGTKSRRGYSLVQAHQDSDSSIYAEIYKLAKACEYEIEKEQTLYEERMKDEFDKKEAENSYHLHIPVLVLDAPLVEVFINENGETIVEQKEISTLGIQVPWKDFYEEDFSIIVITKQIFVEFAKDIITFSKKVLRKQKDVQKYLAEHVKSENQNKNRD